ncbi:MAG: PQQ-binding-like beta-propeller repeat protein [Pirellulales bacterium]
MKGAPPNPRDSAAPNASAIDVPDLGTRSGGVDWPDFLGPGRDSKSPETGILTEWPPEGPPLVWKRTLGVGYATCSISRGRLLMFERFGDQARLTCMRSETGEEIWRFEYPTQFEDLLGYNNGPRCAPTIDGNRVYIYGPEGMLHCVRLVDGEMLWRLDTAERYHVVQNFFGVGSSPLIEGERLILQVGGSPPGSPPIYSGRVQGADSGIIALNKYDGSEVYRLTDELASYASPVAATIGGQRWCFSLLRGGLVGFEPTEGKLRFHFPWRAESLESVNAATPVVFDDRVFISETYGPGSAMLKVKPSGYDVVWSDEERRRDKAMQAHWNTPIHHKGYIYGSSGRHTANAELRCIDAADGSIKWSQPGLTRCTLLYVDGHFVCLGEYGELRLIRASPEKYEEVAQAELESDGQPLLRYPAWAAPVLSHGLLYLRGDSHLVCLELIPEQK